MGRLLDRLYWAAAIMSAMFIVLICILISAQVFLNILGRFAPGVLPSTIPSYADFSGFMPAAAKGIGKRQKGRGGEHKARKISVGWNG